MPYLNLTSQDLSPVLFQQSLLVHLSIHRIFNLLVILCCFVGSANFDTVPVVAGIVLIVFIIAVMMIVLVIVVMIAKRRRQKYTLSRAR